MEPHQADLPTVRPEIIQEQLIRQWLSECPSPRVDYSAFRREFRLPRFPLPLKAEPALPEESDSGVSEDVKQQLDLAMNALTARQRDAIILRELEGKTFPQIAIEMGIKRETARSYHDVGLCRLRKLFAAEKN